MALLPRPRINEFVFNNPGTDANEYVEILFDSNTSLAGYYLVVLDGDAGSAVGRVNNVISLGTTNANGYYVTPYTGDGLVGTTPLQNGTQTLLLVQGGTPPAIGTDFDTNNDGVLDLAVPWTSVIDAVAVNDGGGADFVFFGAPVLSVSATIGGYSRIPDGTDTNTATDWLRNDFDLAGVPGIPGTPIVGEALNTPGAANQAVAAGVVPGISVSTTSLGVAEGGANASFTVVLQSQPSADVTVALSVGVDLALSAASLTFTTANWNVAQTVTVSAIDDAFVEGAETDTVVIAPATSSDTGYAGLNAPDVSVGITDNDSVLPVAAVINEFVFNHTGTDTAEYIEIKAAPSSDLSSYRLVVIEGDSESSFLGSVVNILTPGSTNAAGYWLSALLNSQLQNGSQTLLLVRDPSGLASGQDLDTNNDGVLDVTPWGALIDAVAVSDGGAADLFYLAAPVLTPGFDGGTFTVGGASRLPDGADTNLAGDWARNDFTQVGAGSGTVAGEANNTPGTANAYSVAPVAGFQITPATVSVTEGGAAGSVSIRLTKAPTADVTISVTGSSDASVNSASLTFTAANWSSFQTVVITAVDDLLVEGTEATPVVLGVAVSADAAYGGLNPADITVNVIDNEPVPVVAIHTIQGAAHLSPLVGQTVRTTGIVIARDTTNSGASETIGFWIQDPAADADLATSEAIFVFTGTAAGLPAVGDAVSVTGTVFERSPANNAANLTTTRLEGVSVAVLSSGNALPTATVIGTAGRVAPKSAIYNDAAGNLNSGIGDFDPINEGIDFFESLEGMRVAVSNAVVVGATNGFNETWVLADLGAGSAGRSVRGGVLLGNGDDNPERIQLQFDSGVLAGAGPQANVGDRLGTVNGILTYDFGNYEVALTEAALVTAGKVTQEKTNLVGDGTRLTIAEFNVENLDPSDTKFAELARLFADHLKNPDILALQEVQDNSGPTNNGVTDATLTAAKLIAAIYVKTGLVYSYADVSPANNTSGGEPGGNIRNGYLYNTARVALVPGSLRAITDTAATAGDAFNSSRQPLAADFRFNNQNVTLINVHSSSKGGSGSLFGANQPAANGGEAARIAQATEIKAVVDGILAATPTARIGVLGDFNEFAWNASQQVLTGGASPNLFDLASLLAANDRYSYVFDGSTQQLDHTLATAAFRAVASHDIVHINAEFADATRISDHDPSITRLTLAALGLPQSPSFVGGPADATNTYLMAAGGTTTGGAGADILIARAGTGTLVGGLGADLFTFVNGLAGGAVTIADFTAADHLSLQGFAAGALASALASQVVTGAGTALALADGTQLFLTGVAGVTSANFL